MSEQELTAAERQRLATELLGWKLEAGMLYEHYVGVNGGWPTALHNLTTDDFHPGTDWAQGGMVAEELVRQMHDAKPRGYLELMAGWFDSAVSWSVFGVKPGDFRLMDNISLLLAICRAALAWLDAEKEKP